MSYDDYITYYKYTSYDVYVTTKRGAYNAYLTCDTYITYNTHIWSTLHTSSVIRVLWQWHYKMCDHKHIYEHVITLENTMILYYEYKVLLLQMLFDKHHKSIHVVQLMYHKSKTLTSKQLDV